MAAQLTTVSGLVIPVDWDQEGNPVRVAIYSEDEGRYFVENDDTGRELLALLQQEIETEGVVKRSAKKGNVIAVKSYWLRVERDLWNER